MLYTTIHGGDMNERIKQLSIEAGFPEWSNHAIEFELEKFAELIVRECVEVAFCNFHVSGGDLGNLLKEHFGVE